MAADIAAYHHEWWDGAGYPEGLSGGDIPLPARIVALADTHDALSTRRPYKEPLAEQQCETLIAESAGTHLDPSIVKVFFGHVDTMLQIRERWKDVEEAEPSLLR